MKTGCDLLILPLFFCDNTSTRAHFVWRRCCFKLLLTKDLYKYYIIDDERLRQPLLTTHLRSHEQCKFGHQLEDFPQWVNHPERIIKQNTLHSKWGRRWCLINTEAAIESLEVTEAFAIGFQPVAGFHLGADHELCHAYICQRGSFQRNIYRLVQFAASLWPIAHGERKAWKTYSWGTFGPTLGQIEFLKIALTLNGL